MPQALHQVRQSSLLSFKAKSTTKAEILIYGQIGESFWSEGITDKDFKKQLNELGDVKEIEVRINSPGGDVFHGWTIYNLLKNHKAKKTVYIDGMAASIASIIALAGDEIIMGQGTRYMIHQASSGVWGNKLDMDQMSNLLNSIDDQLISTYMKKTKKTRAEIENWLVSETWFTAEEAVEHGFADSTNGDVQAIAACILDQAKWIKKMPKNILTGQDVAKKNVIELQNKIEGFLARK